MIYLDYNATTPLAPEAMEAMLPFLERDFGNPSSIHRAGRTARAALDLARDQFAELLGPGVQPHEVIFTGGGTEADNLALIGLARAHAEHGRHLVSAPTEHHAVLHAIEYLVKHEQFSVTWLPVDTHGRIDADELAAAITEETILVSIMSANNETGTRQPLGELSAVCRARGILFHTDAVQSFGKEPLNVADCDALSIAAHKFYGPKGAGVLYLRAGIPLQRLQFGGSHENERRAGTENVAAVVGMAAAAQLVHRGLREEQERLAALRDRLWNGIRTLFPAAVLNGHPVERLANTLNVTFPELDGESLLINLDIAGICASSGSACMVGSVAPSHVLLAMGVVPEAARSSIRFSLGKQSTAADIEMTLTRLGEILARLSSIVV